MRSVEGHHDFRVLEARLADLIGRAKAAAPEGPFAPIAVVVPTGLLRAHLHARLAAIFGGLLNVHLFHHYSLAREAAALRGAGIAPDAAPSSGPGPPREIPARVREAIVRQALKERGGALAAYAEARPGFVSAITATIGELREAGVDPRQAPVLPSLSARARETLEVYAACAARLDDLGRRGLSDRAGMMRAAIPHVEAFIREKGFRLVVHYGAYELIGINLALMGAVERSGVPLVYLMPYHPSAPAFAFARRFAAEGLRAEPRPVEPPAAEAAALEPPAAEAAGDEARPAEPPCSLLGGRLPFLYDEEAAIPPALEASVSFFHAQGAAAELRETALRILDLHRRERIPLARVAVVARSLAPYAPLLEPIFHDEHGIPFVTHAALPAVREARARSALWLARAVAGDFERTPLLDLCRSGLLRVEGRDVSSEAHAWDRLSREFRVSGGLRAWTHDLPGWVESWEPHVPADADEEGRARLRTLKEIRRRQAVDLKAVVGALARASEGLARARSWTAWADGFDALCAVLLDGFGEGDRSRLDPGAGAVLDVLGEMRDLDEAGIPFEPGSALPFLERALAEILIPIGAVGGEAAVRDNGGVRVLDAMQARGLTFEAVFVIGFNADLFPQRPREDPFLRDADRPILRETIAPALPLKSGRREEEHLILAHLLGSARRHLTLSWQRADESGRARVPSLALREVARATLGAADVSAPQRAALRVATHPAEAGLDTARRFGFLPPGEARLNAALQLRSPRRLLAAAKDLPAPASGASVLQDETLAAGLGMLSVVDEFAPVDLSYDAFVGEVAAPPAAWSPSRLETLGGCPQQYFFRHVLRVEELEEPAEGYEVDLGEIGERVHAILREIYGDLIEKGEISRPGADPKRAARRVFELVDRVWARETEALALRMHPRWPLLWETTSELWRNALVTFVLYDLAWFQEHGSRIIDLEREETASVRLGGRRGALELRGRFDRVSRSGDGGLVVTDYKTSGTPESLERRVEVRLALKGSRVQMPLYVLMAEARAASWGVEEGRAEAEVVGVGPSFAEGPPPEEPHADGYTARALLDPSKFASAREGFLETLRVLIDLAAAGAFPLNAGSSRCSWCPFKRACRRHHAPTLTRIAGAREAAEWLLTLRKNTRQPTLAVVRARGGEEEA